jgi:hypothetical protein
MSFDQFTWRHPQWRDAATSYVFHRDDPAVAHKSNVLLQRVHTGLGYMHAPMVLQHYMICRDTNGSCAHQLLDIARYVPGTFTPDKLECTILKVHSIVSSRGFLEEILDNGTSLNDTSVHLINAEFLKRHGPVLLPQVNMMSDFCAHGKLVHTGEPTGTYTGQHAMLLIGVRSEGGSPRFLLQNWWMDCQFVEVDLDYLLSLVYSKSHGATIVATPQSSVPAGYAHEARLYAETADLDMQELEFDSVPQFKTVS